MAAAAGTKVGTGYVEIRPDFDGFQKAIGRKLNESLTPAFKRAGDDAGRALTDSVSKRVRRDRSDFGLAASLTPIVNRFKKTGDEAGRAFSKGLSRGAPAELNSIAKAMQKAGVSMERTAGSSARAMRSLESDTFGVGRAARKTSTDLLASRHALAAVGQETHSTDRTTRSLTGRLRSMGAELRASRRAASAAGGGFRGFDGTMARVNRSAQYFRNILRLIKWPVFIAGVGLATQALSALASGAIATVSALGPLTGVLIALPAAALVAAQAFGVLKLATAGIGDAVKASLDAEVKGGAQAVDTLRQQEAAAERVADAKRNLTDVQRAAKIAQEDLTDARKSATRELEDMRLAAASSHDAEQQGNLSLIQARKELAKTLRDPAASGLDVRFAEEAVDQARNDLESTRLDAKRAREDYNEAQKAGVEKMPEVVSAKRAEEDANRSVADAQRDLAKAVRDNSDAMKDQGGAATALREKLSQLPKSGQKFVHFLVGLKPRLDALRETAADGFFPGAEKGIRGALKNFGVFRGLVDGTSKSLGRLAAKAGRKLGSEVWGKDLGRLGKLNERIIGRLGDSTLNLADAFRNVLVSAEPFLDWLSKGTEKFSEWLSTESEAGRESGKLAAFFDRTRETMERVWPILKGVGGALLNIGEAARPLGNEILDALGNAAEGWRKWTDNTKGKNVLKQHFTETKPAIFEIGRLIRDASKAFFELGKQRGVAQLLRLVRTELIPALRDTIGGVTGWAARFIKEFGQLRREGVPTFDAFVQTLADHAGQAGVKIAKALVVGFLNAGPLGKLAIGGWLFAKFGGLGAFGGAGKGAGMKFAKGFIAGVLLLEMGKKLKEIAEGEKLGAPKSELFLMDFNKFFADAKTSIPAGGQVQLSTAMGELIFNANTRRVVAAQGDKLKQFVGDTLNSKLAASIKTLEGNVGRRSGGVVDAARKGLRSLGDVGRDAGSRLKDGFLPKLSKIETGTAKAMAHIAESAADGAKNVGAALSNVFDNLAGALAAIGEKKIPKFSLKVLSTASAYHHTRESTQSGLGRQPELATGGLAGVVPGHGPGDRHTLSLNGRPVAKVESKEGIFVGNRNLMGALSEANAAVPRFQKGGQLGKEPVLGGPGGSLRELGQAAIGKVFDGAKDYLDKHKPSFGGGLLTGSGPVEKVFADVARKLSRSKTATLALGEAGFAESGMRDLGYGDSTSQGSLQLLASTAASTGIDPHDEAAVASAFLLNGYTGKGGANKLAAQGLPAQLVAQGVQGSAFSDGSNYLAQEGPAKQWMRRFRLQQGGLVQRLAQGGQLGQPFDPRVMHGGPASGPRTLLGSLSGYLPKTIGRIKAKAQQIAQAFTGYVWGGGHDEGTNVTANGLDCSGAIAKLMQESGWTDFAVAHSSEYARRFHPGAGDLFTIWSNDEHTFADIEGTQWGTNTFNGLGYHTHTTAGFTPTHPSLATEGSGSTGTATGAAAAPKETVRDYYKGVKAGAQMDFGPMPKNLEGVENEIKRLRGKVGTYRQAKRHAEKNDKPDTAAAIGRNLAAIEARLSGLSRKRSQLRLANVKKALKKRLGGKLNKFAGYEQIIEGAEGTYNRASQDAEQIVALEPLQPELPASATDAQREAAEKTYVANFTNYVDTQERPAYTRVLDTVADWRNKILQAERFGFGKDQPSVEAMSGRWEGELFNTRSRISQIRDFAKEVNKNLSDWKAKNPKGEVLPDWLKGQLDYKARLLEQLPPLQLKNTKLTESLASAREMFFSKGDVTPPRLPLPGSGSLEERLRDVQGIHWPDQHELLPAGALAPPRIAGRFGGAIWNVQEAIEGLDLKITQARNSLGGPNNEDAERNAENASLLEELLRQSNMRNVANEVGLKVFRDFEKTYSLRDLPKFHTGGVVPGPPNREIVAKLRGQEGVFTPEQMNALGTAASPAAGAVVIEQIVIHEDGTATAKVDGQELRAAVRDVVRQEPALRLR